MSEKETYKFEKEGDIYITTVCGERFAFRKWTWGEKNTLATECSTINPMTNEVSFDTIRFNEQLFIRTVKYEAGEKFVPFTIEEIRGMDAQLGDRLFRLTQKLNMVSNIEAQNL